ncbi:MULTISPECIES: ABC transporter ATP-binding protein [unclassified Exiguobacterium]|uniref:ABC transporter ATP-binding protein n=1 Tax=unclassified Exiguobacterium TaxID=2644629 RepID=UPI002036FF12|nr:MULTISPECIES: ATP-binding cassette domain-containing protein [unclassified Exiguobacterium]
MIHIQHVNKVYKTGDIETTALKDIDLTINDGAFVVILGPSRSGKSTLLNVISGLDTVTSGTITFGDTVLTDLSSEQMTAFRRDHLGFIFQQYNLLQNLTVYENVQIGADLSTDPLPIEELLDQVGLAAARDKYPYQLSGGEQHASRSPGVSPKIRPSSSATNRRARSMRTIQNGCSNCSSA